MAELNRYDFLDLCAQQGISVIQYSAGDIAKEIAQFTK